VVENQDLIDTLERNWRDALCGRDMERLAALMHPEFVLIGTRSTGPFMMNRDEWLEAVQRRDLETIDFEIKEVTSLEDVMIATVHARWRIKYLGRVIEDCVLSTDVWVRRGDDWVSIRRHSTPAPGQCGNLKGE
jgi:ketosteroid isomerase-like protein